MSNTKLSNISPASRDKLIEDMADVMAKMTIDEREGRADWSSEEIVEAMLSVAERTIAAKIDERADALQEWGVIRELRYLASEIREGGE